MNKEFIEWLKLNKYTHYDTTYRDGHIWRVNKHGLWKWNEILEYEY